MVDLITQPTNPNFLADHNFRFSMKRAPNLSYFAQKASIPGINLNAIQQASPFGQIWRNGTGMTFEEFSLTFKVDEDFGNYLELFNWMVGLGFPNDFSDYAALAAKKPMSGEGLYSDASLMILSSSKNPNIEVQFIQLFPIALTALDMDVGSDATYIDATATFKYQRFYINRLT